MSFAVYPPVTDRTPHRWRELS